jgi:hypothetical protein
MGTVPDGFEVPARAARATPKSGPDFLLRLPAIRDNAALQIAPPNADALKQRRHCLQFSLRTLLVLMVLEGT